MKRNIKLFNFWFFLASGFGSGLFKFFPGTFGSIIAVLIWLLIYKFFSFFWIGIFIFFSFFLVFLFVKKYYF